MTDMVCLGLLTDIASKRIVPNPGHSSPSYPDSMDLVRLSMGLVPFPDLVVAGFPIGNC